MAFSLAALIRRTRNPRRSTIPIRDIRAPTTLATNLYRACYLPIVQAVERAAARISAEYERTLAQLTQDSPADVDAELAAFQQELQRLLLILTPRMRDWAIRTEAWHRGRWRGSVLSATGVDLQTMIGPEAARQSLEAAIAWNTSLMRDVGEQARQRIAAAVFAGLQARTPAREVAADIREAVAMSRARSIRIASDQLTKVTAALDTERMQEAGIGTWIWRWSHKRHGRPQHIARDGHQFSFDHPPSEMPGVLPFCGCRKQAVVSLD